MDIKIVTIKTHSQGQLGWLAMINDEIVGHIFMEEQKDKKLKFLDAWVSEKHRRKGVYKNLWNTRWQYVKDNYEGWTAYAWCKPMSLPLLIEKGFSKGDTCVYVEKLIEDDEVPYTFVSC